MKKKPKSEKRSEWQRKVMEKFKRELALRPVVTDEEFMAETEVSDEEYKRGMTLPGPQ